MRFFLYLLLFMLSTSAWAQENSVAPEGEEPQKSFFESFNEAFGGYVVGPLASIMFFDLVFWDEDLAHGTIPKKFVTVKQKEEVTGKERKIKMKVISYSPAEKTYQLADPVDADIFSAYPSLEKPINRKSKFDYFDWKIQDSQTNPGQLEAVIPKVTLQQLKVALTPIEQWNEAVGTPPELAAGYKRFVTTILTEDNVPVVIDVPAAAPAGRGPFLIQASSVPLRYDYIKMSDADIKHAYVNGKRIHISKKTSDRIEGHSVKTLPYPHRLPNPSNIQLPVVVLWLVFGAVFFTFRMSFINIRGFKHAIEVTTGKYDNPDDPGEVTHFQALSSALSATVGLGNIAGVAVAVAVGGPGAIVWMIIAGFFGMSSKFTECTLGQMYRQVDSKGVVSGGPMRYLDLGLKELGVGSIGKVLAVIFAVMCIGGSLGGGNMFQANQSFAQMATVLPALAPKAQGVVTFEVTRKEQFSNKMLSGEIIDALKKDITIPANTRVSVAGEQAFLTQNAVTIPKNKDSVKVQVVAAKASKEVEIPIGSVSKIETFAYGTLHPEKQISSELRRVYHAGLLTVSNAQPIIGGGPTQGTSFGVLMAFLVGLVILGGIRSIGVVASLIVPLMCAIYVLAGMYILLINIGEVPAAFALMIKMAFSMDSAYGGLIGALIQGFRRAAFSNEAGVGSAAIAHSAAATDEPVREGVVALLEPFIDTILICTMTGLVLVVTGVYTNTDLQGVELTSMAFGSAISWFPTLLTTAVFFFAYSTMISWSYYGERCATYLFGEGASVPYKLLFMACVVLGATFDLGVVLDFSDLMILGMAFPNILGLLMLSTKVRVRLDEYLEKMSQLKLDEQYSKAD